MLKPDQIRQLIESDMLSEKKRLARQGEAYYWANHDILNYRMYYWNADGILVEDKTRANNRICHPYFTELVDQLASYATSFKENPIKAKPFADGLQSHLDKYFDDEFYSEIRELIAGSYMKGFEYLYAFKNAKNRLTFHCADSLGVVEVRARETADNCDYMIYCYVDRVGIDKKVIKRIEVHDKDQIYFYTQVDNGDIELDKDEPINPRPNILWTDNKTGEKLGNSLGFIPFWRLDYNKKQISGLKPIKAIIDDYDLMQCGLSNNLQDFDTPIHLVKGFEGDNLDELQQNIKTKKMLGVDNDGGLEILTVNIPYQARKIKADEDEKNIYKYGMGFNSSQVGDGNITNVVIISRYTSLDLKANKILGRLKSLLKSVIEVVLDEINQQNNTAYQYSDVVVDFDLVIPTNEQENAQIALVKAQTEQTRVTTVLNAATVIGDEETLRLICEVYDLDFAKLKANIDGENAQMNLNDAMQVLNEP